MSKPKQHIPKHLRYTIQDFDREFPTNDVCLEFIKEQRWPNGITLCDKCGVDRKHHRVSGRTAYACDYCGNHIYPLAGTIFEKSTTALRTWFHAMFQMASTRCGISAKQIQRETGVTYKTAWRMFKQIRSLMAEGFTLGGEGSHGVEMDETYMGGKRKGYRGRPGAGDKKKTPVVGIVERKGRVIARATPTVNADALTSMVKEYVLPESTIFTDDFSGYDRLKKHGFTHHRINHTAKVYVMGDIHTNTIEGFWSLVKRGIGGVYHAVSKKYLQTYLDEYSFRYNRRDAQVPMFTLMLSRVSELALESPSVPASENHPV